MVELWLLLTFDRRIPPQRFHALVGSHRICICAFPPAPPASTLWALDDIWDISIFSIPPCHGVALAKPGRPYMQFLFVQSGFPLELLSYGSFPLRSCSSGLRFRIISVPLRLSPQFAYRVGRTIRSAETLIAIEMLVTTPKFISGI